MLAIGNKKNSSICGRDLESIFIHLITELDQNAGIFMASFSFHKNEKKISFFKYLLSFFVEMFQWCFPEDFSQNLQNYFKLLHVNHCPFLLFLFKFPCTGKQDV